MRPYCQYEAINNTTKIAATNFNNNPKLAPPLGALLQQLILTSTLGYQSIYSHHKGYIEGKVKQTTKELTTDKPIIGIKYVPIKHLTFIVRLYYHVRPLHNLLNVETFICRDKGIIIPLIGSVAR